MTLPHDILLIRLTNFTGFQSAVVTTPFSHLFPTGFAPIGEENAIHARQTFLSGTCYVAVTWPSLHNRNLLALPA